MPSEQHRAERELRRARVEGLQRAAELAESQQSVLAVPQWNDACQRIRGLIEAEIRNIENGSGPGEVEGKMVLAQTDTPANGGSEAVPNSREEPRGIVA